MENKRFIKNYNKGNVLNVLIIASIAILLSLIMVCAQAKSFSASADEVNFPGAESLGSDSGTNATATTQVYLKVDDSQLKFTAPSRIDFILDADGNFTCPSDVVFKNDSVMDIEVVNYKVDSESGCTGVEDADDSKYASQSDVYSVKVTPTHTASQTNADYPFAVSYNTNESNNTDWVITAAEKSVKLTFSKGRMPHPSKKWSNTAAKLQTVTWSVSTAS